MVNFSLILAASASDAELAAIQAWKWEATSELRCEFRRPDTGERVRYVYDGPQSLQNLRWNTRVYLVDGWRKRQDASSVMGMIDAGFFTVEDPELPPPRPKARRDDILSELRKRLDEFATRRR